MAKKATSSVQANKRKVEPKVQARPMKQKVVERKGLKVVKGLGENPSTGPKKEISQKFLEAMERRKKDNAFGRIPGRRGRRPKNQAEYNPEHQEDDSYGGEAEIEHLEYDTGIRVSKGRDETGFSLERAEEFDEELNFDW